MLSPAPVTFLSDVFQKIFSLKFSNADSGSSPREVVGRVTLEVPGLEFSADFRSESFFSRVPIFSLASVNDFSVGEKDCSTIKGIVHWISRNRES